MKILQSLMVLSIFFVSIVAKGQLNQVYPEVFAVDGIPGYTTYRIFAEMENPTDLVSSVFAAGDHLLSIGGSGNVIWNAAAGAAAGDDLSIGFCGILPEICFDSYVTIGMVGEENTEGESINCGEVVILSTIPVSGIENSFNNGISENLNLVDGAWVVPGNPGCMDNGVGVGPNLKVLLAQVTIPSEDQLEYVLNLQVYDDGDGSSPLWYLGAPTSLLANQFDGSQIGLAWPIQECADENENDICDDMEIQGCTSAGACNYNSEATLDDESCFFATVIYDCDGNCQVDLNEDGICDQEEGQNAENYCGDGTVWDPLTQTCMGIDDCPSDINGDDVVDTSDILQLLVGMGNPCE